MMRVTPFYSPKVPPRQGCLVSKSRGSCNTMPISAKSLASTILGLLSLGLLAVTGIPAFIVGLRAMREINASDGRIGGRGFALFGMALGALGTAFCLIGTVAIGLLW